MVSARLGMITAAMAVVFALGASGVVRGQESGIGHPASGAGNQESGIGDQESERDDQEEPTEARPRAVQVRASGHVSVLALAASDTFDATLGSATAVEYGAGGALLLPRGFFVAVDLSRVEKDGERVFVHNGEVFGLDIPMTVTMTPIDLTAGYRVGAARDRRPRTSLSERRGLPFVPYAGGGIGWLSYRETSSFADPRENVDERFTSYHVLGGVEIPVWRVLGTSAEIGYRWVPDVLDDTNSSAAALFDESDLGGLRFRVTISATF